MMGFGVMNGFGWIGMGLGLVFWATLIIVLVRSLTARDGVLRTDEPNPDEILRRRYARGEIDLQQFREAQRTLRGH